MSCHHPCCHQPKRSAIGPLLRWGLTLASIGFFAWGDLAAAGVTGLLAWAGWQTARESGCC